jgi:hypothetical protein
MQGNNELLKQVRATGRLELGGQKRTSTLTIKKDGDKLAGTMSWPVQKETNKLLAPAGEMYLPWPQGSLSNRISESQIGKLGRRMDVAAVRVAITPLTAPF